MTKQRVSRTRSLPPNEMAKIRKEVRERVKRHLSYTVVPTYDAEIHYRDASGKQVGTTVCRGLPSLDDVRERVLAEAGEPGRSNVTWVIYDGDRVVEAS